MSRTLVSSGCSLAVSGRAGTDTPLLGGGHDLPGLAANLCLGIAIASVNTLIGIGLFGDRVTTTLTPTGVFSANPCRVDERLFDLSTKQSDDGPRRFQQFQLE